MREIRNLELISEGRRNPGDGETGSEETGSEETGSEEIGGDETQREGTGGREEEKATSANPNTRADPGPAAPGHAGTPQTEAGQDQTGQDQTGKDQTGKDQTGKDQTDPGTTTPEIKQLLTETGHKEVGDLQEEAGSARTTFRLSVEAERLFERLSERTGNSQKELLGSALRLCGEAWERCPSRFEEQARGLQVEGASQKPMAIGPGVREGLNELREETGVPRDRLVELGIRLAREALQEQARRKIAPHRDILEDLRALRAEVESVQIALSSHEHRTGPGSPPPSYEDPVESALFDMLFELKAMREAVEEELETGEPMGGHRTFP